MAAVRQTMRREQPGQEIISAPAGNTTGYAAEMPFSICVIATGVMVQSQAMTLVNQICYDNLRFNNRQLRFNDWINGEQ